MAGDIGSLYKIKQLSNFLESICKYYKLVIYIPGNHEWYTVPSYKPLSYKILEQRLEQLNKAISNLYVLNRNSIVIGKYCICGATLWTNPNNTFNKYIVRIHNITIEKYKKMHNNDLTYIKKIKEYCKVNNLKLVVVTHHPPTLKVLEENKKCKKFPHLYASNLEYLLENNIIKTWICGHTHKNFNLVINNCNIVSNQKGKRKDKVVDYSKSKIFEI